jgi:septal ring factor EnvC (AmiA/AmiB activator)
MNGMVRKELVLAIGSCLIAMLFAGCEEQNLSTAKKNKLMAYENKQLEERLAQQEKKIEEQNRLLEECQQKRNILEKEFKEEVNAKISKAMELFSRMSKQLKQENDKLKAQVSKLEQQLKESESTTEPQSLAP